MSCISLFDFVNDVCVISNMFITREKKDGTYAYHVIYICTEKVIRIIDDYLFEYPVVLKNLITEYVGQFDSNIQLSNYMVECNFTCSDIESDEAVFNFPDSALKTTFRSFDMNGSYNDTMKHFHVQKKEHVLKTDILTECNNDNGVFIDYLYFFNRWIFNNKGIINFLDYEGYDENNFFEYEITSLNVAKYSITCICGSMTIGKVIVVISDPIGMWYLMLMIKACIESCLKYSKN